MIYHHWELVFYNFLQGYASCMTSITREQYFFSLFTHTFNKGFVP